MSTHDHDRIAIPSLKADGSWDQTPDAEIVGDPEVAKDLAGEQAAVKATSDVDAAVRRNPDQDPKFESVDKLRDQQKKAASSARKAAESKVSKASK